MSDLKCPHCFHPHDIHPDMEIHEDVKYQWICEHCKKQFQWEAWTTTHFMSSVAEDEDELL